MIAAKDSAPDPEFRIITEQEFLALSRAEKLSYIRSAIHAHAQFARREAPPAPAPGGE